ncbi:MAG: hypothetical protein RLP12_07740, partial [Ekhidna sp.]
IEVDVQIDIYFLLFRHNYSYTKEEASQRESLEKSEVDFILNMISVLSNYYNKSLSYFEFLQKILRCSKTISRLPLGILQNLDFNHLVTS